MSLGGGDRQALRPFSRLPPAFLSPTVPVISIFLHTIHSFPLVTSTDAWARCLVVSLAWRRIFRRRPAAKRSLPPAQLRLGSAPCNRPFTVTLCLFSVLPHRSAIAIVQARVNQRLVRSTVPSVAIHLNVVIIFGYIQVCRGFVIYRTMKSLGLNPVDRL